MCVAGKYSAVVGAADESSCSACPAGTFLATEGNDAATDCEACAAGTYSEGVGQSQCTPCPAGTFSPHTGVSLAISCTKCPPGTHRTTPGGVACTPCLPGLISVGLGNADCEPCPTNWYALVSGQAVCVEGCPPSEFTSVVATTAPFVQCAACSPLPPADAAFADTACSGHQDSARWAYPASAQFAPAELRTWLPAHSANLLEQHTAPARSAPVSGFESVLVQTGAQHTAQCVAVAPDAPAGARPALGPCPRAAGLAGASPPSRALVYLLEHDGTPATRLECNCAAEVFRLSGGGGAWHGASSGEAAWSLMGAFALRVLVSAGTGAALRLQAPTSVSMPNMRRYRISVLVRGAGFAQLNGGSLQQIPSDTAWTLLWEYMDAAPCADGSCAAQPPWIEVALTLREGASTPAEVELDNLEFAPVLTEASADLAQPSLYEVDVSQTDPWMRAATDGAAANILQKPSASQWGALALSVHLSPPPSGGSCSVRPVVLPDADEGPASLLGQDGLDRLQCIIQADSSMCALSLPLAAANSRGRIGLLLGAECEVNMFHGFAGPNTARFVCADGARFPRFRPHGQACASCWAPSGQDRCPADKYLPGCYTEAPPGRHAHCRQCGHRIFPDGLLDFVSPARRAFHCELGCRPGSVASDAPDCVLCGEGLYSSMTGQTECSRCPPGSLALAVGGTSLDTCGAAPPCDRGHVFDVPSRTCAPCPAGTYKPGRNHDQCAPCPAHSTTHARGGATSVDECVFCTRHAFWNGSLGCALCPVCEMIAESRHQRAACDRCPFTAAPGGDAPDPAQCPMLGLQSVCFAQAPMEDVHACAEDVLANSVGIPMSELRDDSTVAPASCLGGVYAQSRCRAAPPTLRLDPSYGLGMPGNAELSSNTQDGLYAVAWWEHCAARDHISPKANVCKVYAAASSGGANATRRRFLYVPSGYTSLAPGALSAVEESSAKTTASNYGCRVCGSRETSDMALELDTAPGMTLFMLTEPVSVAVARKTQFFDVARLGMDHLKATRVIPDYNACMEQTVGTDTSVDQPASADTARRICMLPTRSRSAGVNTYEDIGAVDQHAALSALEHAWSQHFRAKDRAESASWEGGADLHDVALLAVRVRVADEDVEFREDTHLEVVTGPDSQTVDVEWDFSQAHNDVTGIAAVGGAAWLHAPVASRVRVDIPVDGVTFVEVWLCKSGGRVCTLVADGREVEPPHYYSCDGEEYSSHGARLQHGAHLARLRSTLAGERMCGMLDSQERRALGAAARAQSVQGFDARSAQGLCGE